jgi:M6 family metalloprotease-like protein
MFNVTGAGVNSMVSYFVEASYNVFSCPAAFYPTPGATVVSYQDVYTRGYYQPYNAVTNPIGYTGGDNGTDRTNREHTLLASAVNAVSSQIPAGLNIDVDSDGYVDNVCFIVSGSPTGWASLLWPHKWSLYTQTVYINGKRVSVYNLQLRNSLISSGPGVLCHEMFHSLGAPDLYHYSYDGFAPVSSWDLMEANKNPPQHMGAYMKWKYGTWLASIPEILTSGWYSLQPLTSSTNNAYKIKSPVSTTEFFVLEYRRKEGTFESSLPGTGLLAYRINTTVTGNASGPPDEVYIYRPGGTPSANGLPAGANLGSDVGRTAINDTTDPFSFLTNGNPGGLSISSVGAAGSTITFYVTVNPLMPPTVTTAGVTNIQKTTATSGGTVVADGGSAVTARGACWNRTGSPTIADSRTIDGSGTGAFSSSLTGLLPGTTYSLRAYATNAAGTYYGSPLSFRTIGQPQSLPLIERFDSAALPGGWNTQNAGTGITERWSIVNSNFAGGSAYEARCTYQDVYPGTTRLITPPLITTGMTSLNPSFKHYFDDYAP